MSHNLLRRLGQSLLVLWAAFTLSFVLLQVLPGWSFWQGVALVTLGSLICWWATRSSRD